MKKIMKNLATALLIGTAAVTSIKAGSSVEFLAGDKSAFVDLQTSNDLTKRLNLSTQGKFTTGYDNKNMNGFLMLDIYGSMGAGFMGDIETQACSGSNVVPRAGLAYYKKFGNYDLFLQSTASLKKNTDIDYFGQVKYKKSITDKLGIAASSTNWVNAGLKNFNCFLSKDRLGITDKGYTIGPACDISFGPDYKVNFNTGVSVMKEF